jgi:hypothetical protein
MTRTLLIALLAVIWVNQGAYAQARSRPATASDFTGVFELIEYPPDQQPKYFKENPWPAPCQFFGHYPDGYWLHQQQTALRKARARSGSCTNTITSRKPALPQTVSWKMLRDGFVLIDRADYKVQEIWKVDHINGPTHLTPQLNSATSSCSLTARESNSSGFGCFDESAMPAVNVSIAARSLTLIRNLCCGVHDASLYFQIRQRMG